MSWAEIKKAINSNISKSLDVLITEKCNELKSKLNSVYSTVAVTGNIPFIKSIQRGIIDTRPYVTTYSINISQINPDKSIVILYGSGTAVNRDTGRSPYLANLTDTALSIGIMDSVTSEYYTNFSWEVIEFY